MFHHAEPVTKTDICSAAAVRRVAAMLDLDPDGIAEGDALPRGWHFILLGAETRRSELRADGFPGLGVPMPDLGLPRLLLGGRTVEYLQDIPVGVQVQRTSGIRSLTRKDGQAGSMVIATIGHELRVADSADAAIIETQTYFLLPAGSARRESKARTQAIPAAQRKTLIPDETLLFQYSALGFNSHKIHIDKLYAQEVEGFPDLVVNGGLTALLITEFARRDLGLSLRSLKMKNITPLFCGRTMTLAADRDAERWRLAAYDDSGAVAADVEVEIA